MATQVLEPSGDLGSSLTVAGTLNQTGTSDVFSIPIGHGIVVADVDEALAACTLQPAYSTDSGSTYKNIDLDLEGRSYPETVAGSAVPKGPKTFSLPTQGESKTNVLFKLFSNNAQTAKTYKVNSRR